MAVFGHFTGIKMLEHHDAVEAAVPVLRLVLNNSHTKIFYINQTFLWGSVSTLDYL